MRVVAPFTSFHPLAVAALERYAAGAERVDVSEHDNAYWRLVSDLWARQETVLLVEHDIEIHADVVDELAACPEPWCAFGYHIGNGELLFRGLGCTKFTGDLMAAMPGAPLDPGVLGPGQVPATDWRRLDTRVTGQLGIAGYEPHRHGPPVLHHHRYLYPGQTAERCACGGGHE